MRLKQITGQPVGRLRSLNEHIVRFINSSYKCPEFAAFAFPFWLPFFTQGGKPSFSSCLRYLCMVETFMPPTAVAVSRILHPASSSLRALARSNLLNGRPSCFPLARAAQAGLGSLGNNVTLIFGHQGK